MRQALINGLSAALPLLALAWALEVFRAVGLILFAEQVLMAMLAITLPLAYLSLTPGGARRDAGAPLPAHDILAARRATRPSTTRRSSRPSFSARPTRRSPARS